MDPRFLRRTNVAPLAQDFPVAAIAQWLAREIQQAGHLTHEEAINGILINFGGIVAYCSYSEPLRDSRAKVIGKRRLLHPEILRALKQLTGKNIVWEKECREWWARKVGAAPRRRDHPSAVTAG